MKCTLVILCAVAVGFSAYVAAADQRAGVWTASLREDDPTTLEISLFQGRGHDHNNIMGYDLATRKEVVEIAIFRITAATVREFARLGYSDLTLRELVDMRVGRVDAAFVSGMKELGYNLAAREIANLAILGVTPAYIREL